MPTDTVFVFALIGICALLMASNRVRFDLVALLVLIALMLSGILTPNETLSGFGSTVVISVAGLLVVGHILDRTGVANAIGNIVLQQSGTSETWLLVLPTTASAVLMAPLIFPFKTTP